MSTHLFREASTPDTEAAVSPSSEIFVEAKANLVPGNLTENRKLANVFF